MAASSAFLTTRRASTVRQLIKAVLAHGSPGALTAAAWVLRSTLLAGVPVLDALLRGGVPTGALSELVEAMSKMRRKKMMRLKKRLKMMRLEKNPRLRTIQPEEKPRRRKEMRLKTSSREESEQRSVRKAEREFDRVHVCTVRSALPAAGRTTLLKLLHLELQAHPPAGGVVGVALRAVGHADHQVQLDLFNTTMPEVSRLDVMLGRQDVMLGGQDVKPGGQV